MAVRGGSNAFTFDAICNDIAQRLSDGAANRRSPRTRRSPPRCRRTVMVLRGFDPESWTLRFHTDARSPKVAVIEDDPRIGVLAYDKQAKLQLRLRGTGRIVTTGQAVDSAWSQSDNFARRCYLGSGPGEHSDQPTSGLPTEFEGVEPTDDQVNPARENFALLLVQIEEADWFSLAHTGHRRALFIGDEGRWISP